MKLMIRISHVLSKFVNATEGPLMKWWLMSPPSETECVEYVSDTTWYSAQCQATVGRNQSHL